MNRVGSLTKYTSCRQHSQAALLAFVTNGMLLVQHDACSRTLQPLAGQTLRWHMSAPTVAIAPLCLLLLTRWNSPGSSCMRLKLASLGLLVTASRRATWQQCTAYVRAAVWC